MLSKAIKSPKTKIHVGLVKNINNVAANSSQKPINKGIVGFFFF
jgi:hypothetical protein